MGYRTSVPDTDKLKVERSGVSTAAAQVPATGPARSSTLERALRLAASGHDEAAYGLLKHEGSRDPLSVNAKGVCLLRLGRFTEAADLFRNLVLAPGCMWMRKEAPISFKVNFATALLLAGHPSGCLDVLAEIGDENHATVIAIRAALRQWANQLPLWQRLNWRVGRIEPAQCRPTVDFVPGDFGFAVGLAPTARAATGPAQQTAV